jgi:Ser/Thr protein kinase RdoA (MazF antagonist)
MLDAERVWFGGVRKVGDLSLSANTVPVLRSLPTADGLTRLIEAAYGLAGVRCRLIQGTIRDTYRVDSNTGAFVLSLYRHGHRTVAEIAAELDLLDAVATGGQVVPGVVPLRTGERILTIRAPEGIRHAVLFTFVSGSPLGRTPEPGPARSYGRAIARVHAIAEALPAPLTRPRIDIDELLLRPLAAFAGVAEHRPADVAELSEIAIRLARQIEAFPIETPGYGLVHGDVIPSNALVRETGDVALLDFDFCGYGWRAYDVATYLGEVRFWDASPAIAEGFVAGYEEIRPLERWERAALPIFESARHIFALGVPAAHVNEWGSSYLSDRMIDALLDVLRRSLTEVDRG